MRWRLKKTIEFDLRRRASTVSHGPVATIHANNESRLTEALQSHQNKFATSDPIAKWVTPSPFASQASKQL